MFADVIATVSGILENSTGTGLVNKVIEFRPRSPVVRGREVIESDTVAVTTAAGGSFTIQLSGCEYNVFFAEKYQFSITVPNDGQEHEIGDLVTRLSGPGGSTNTGGVSSAALTAETQARIAGDAANASALVALGERVILLESGNTNGVDQIARDAVEAEQLRAQTEEGELSGRITTLEAGNTNGVDQTARDAVGAEQQRAQTEEAGLSTRIANLEAGNMNGVDQTARDQISELQDVVAQQADTIADQNDTISAQAQTIASQAATISALQAVAPVIINLPEDPGITQIHAGKIYLNTGTGSLIWKRNATELTVINL